MSTSVKRGTRTSSTVPETYIIKAYKPLKETDKAYLFLTDEGSLWIPKSFIENVKIKENKKRPFRIEVLHFFEPEYKFNPNVFEQK